VTDPEIQRDEVIYQHENSIRPTVLISPSLHTGLDLKDNLSRFQIITKVLYPNKSDTSCLVQGGNQRKLMIMIMT
jgi:ATP-dependent DNA helicase DinG